MTKRIILIIGLMMMSLSVLAVQVDVGGEVNLFTKLSSKPSSKRGQLSFELPSSLLNIDVNMNRNNSLFIELQISAHRDDTSKKLQSELTKLFYQWISEEETFFIRYGLLRNFISENDSQFINYDFFDELKPVSRRFNYLPDSDMGMEIHYLLSDYFSFGVGIVNGEENRKDEEGLQKDTYALIDYSDSQFNLGIMYLNGAYDEYEKPFNEKQRVLIKLGWNFGLIKIGGEALRAEDSSAGISEYKRADGWDSIAFPEQVISGEGHSAWLKLGLTEEDSLLVKGDFWDPNKTQEEDEINSHQVMLELKNQLRSLFIGYSSTTYGENHSSFPTEKEYGFIGLRQLF